ncbi:MAG: hypothetical protein HZB53_21825 [Chloroflexi bacterium]|nr:hypothetical protein [Chloroflexota bacterium]
METRAYAIAFMGVLAIICLGAYVAVSALFDTGGDPIVRFDANQTPSAVPVTTRGGTRTPTPTNTPFVPFIPTLIFPTATPVPPTVTPTLLPLPTRILPTRTPTPTDTPVVTPTPVPPAGPTATPTIDPSTFQYRVDSGPTVSTRGCSSGYYIYGFVRDAQNNPLTGVRVKYGVRNVINPPVAVTEAKGYELVVRSDTRWYVQIVDAGERPLSPSVDVQMPPADSGSCWVKLDWKRN